MIAAALPVILPHPFVLTIATQALIWALLAASWDLLSGYTGQISFGHAGFFSVGAYTAATLTKHADVSPWAGLVLGALAAAVIGLLVAFPALRLRGHYLALVTLGFAEIVRLIAQNWMALTGGPFGIYDYRTFPGLPTEPFAYRRAAYWVVLAIVGGSIVAMVEACESTPAAKAFRAIREDEVLAATLGIHTNAYKLLSFGLSAGFAGLAGTLYAYYVVLVSPTVGAVGTTALAIAMAVFGGLGTIWGPAVGALLLYGLNEALRFIGVVYNLIVVGLILMLFVIFVPRGLAGLAAWHGRQGRRLIVWITICLILIWRLAWAEEYRYPYRDPYLATATSVILDGDGQISRPKRLVVHVPGLLGRNELPPLEGRGNLSIAFYRQSHPAPLLFILGGIGSNPYFGLATYFASLFYQRGFSVVIMPSPMTWNFALAASRSGAPGFVPDDARDLYDALQRTLAVLETCYAVKPPRIALMGASLGALEGAYLSVLDADERKIGIDTYLLVNPPLDLNYALKTVDEWNALSAKFGQEGTTRLVGRGLALVEAFAREDRNDPAVFERFAAELAKFTTEEIQFLLAKALQLTLPELIYVTQVLHDPAHRQGGLREARRRIEAANAVTFVDYAERMGVPLWKKEEAYGPATLEEFARRGSLTSILDRLRGNERVYIVHNADDPLSPRSSILELRKVLGDQVTMFPYGGHLGNLWYPENKELVLRILGAPPGGVRRHRSGR